MTAGRVRPPHRPALRRGLGILATVLLASVATGVTSPADAGTPPKTPDATPATSTPQLPASGSATRAGATQAGATRQAVRRATTPVTVTVTDVTPSTPATPRRGAAAQRLRVDLTVTNNGDTAIRNARVLAYRGEPIGNQAALEKSLTDKTAPEADGVDVAPTKAVRVDLAAGQTRSVTFTTTASLANGPGLCLCDNKIYPLILAVRPDAGTGEALGTTQTWVPSVYQQVTPTRVSWVWPLIDRPHRLMDESVFERPARTSVDSVFTDDDLVASVSGGGRLDRALQVLEDVAGEDASIPVTIIADPELLDELAVMATGRYTVRSADGKVTRGTGQDAATAWLQRFTSLLGSDPALQIALTPLADPDVQSLSRNRLTWSPGLPGETAARVQAVLGGREPLSDIAWPAGGGLSQGALSTLVSYGVSTVLLDSPGISPSTDADGLPVAVATLRSAGTRVTAAVVSNQLRATAAAAVTRDTDTGTDTDTDTSAGGDLPKLVSEVAVRAIETGDDPSYAVLAPTRYVDADPARAARAILDTSVSPFATPVALRSLTDQRPKTLSKLRVPSGAVALPGPNLSVADDVTRALPTLTSLIGGSQSDAEAAATLLDALPLAVQRLTSSAWRPSSDSPFSSASGTRLATRLSREVGALLSSVRIVVPQSGTGTYTLGSDESRLPITVENTSAYTVQVRVEVRAQDDLPGYAMTSAPDAQQIAPNSKLTFRVPSKLDRSGRIPLEAQLLTTTDTEIGDEAQLYVRGTVLGPVGVTITVVAGAVLALALLVRFVRRVRRLRRQAAKRRAAEVRSTVAVGGPGADAGGGT